MAIPAFLQEYLESQGQPGLRPTAPPSFTPQDNPVLGGFLEDYGLPGVSQPEPEFTEAAIPEAPTGIMAMLGQSFADQPIQWRPQRGSSGTNLALGFLLSRVANAMGGKSRREEQTRNDTTAFVQGQNRLSDAARRQARRDELVARTQAARDKNQADRQAALQADIAARQDKALAQQRELFERGQRGMESRLGQQIASRGDYKPSRMDTDPDYRAKIEAMARAINRGEPVRVPYSEQGDVTLAMENMGLVNEPPKVREARAAYEESLFSIDELEGMSKQIHTASGLGAQAQQGFSNRKAALLQDDKNPIPRQYEETKKGLSPVLARLVGHVGVLTQADVDYVMGLLPGPEMGKNAAERRWRLVRKFLANKYEARARVLHSEGVASPSLAPSTPASNKATVKIVGDKFVPVDK